MKKWQLSKKKMLGFLTAGAIVVTMAGSYAVWDQLTTTGDSKLVLDKPVTTQLTLTNKFDAGERNLGTINTYSNTATYTTANIPTDTNVEVKITPTIKDTSDQDLTDKFDITLKNGDTKLTLTNGTATDATVDKNGSTTYTVTVKPKNDTDTELMDAAENAEELTVTLESELKTATLPVS